MTQTHPDRPTIQSVFDNRKMENTDKRTAADTAALNHAEQIDDRDRCYSTASSVSEVQTNE